MGVAAMGFLDGLRKVFGGGAGSEGGGANGDPYGLWFHFRCGKCGTPVRIRVDRRNDLNREEGGQGTFLLRKDVMDDKCFQLMHAEVWLDSGYNVVAADVSGGEMISQEEYQEATEAG
jgi:hypothetical protein